jgi:hypothetical protein
MTFARLLIFTAAAFFLLAQTKIDFTGRAERPGVNP